MPDASDSIYYQGPGTFKPESGGTFSFNDSQTEFPDAQANQRLLARVLEWADGLINFHTNKLTEYNLELGDFSLVVHPTAQEDELLRKAQTAAWRGLGLTDKAPDFVNYWQFLALERTPSHASQMVQDRWVQGVRDVTGTMAYDLTLISKAIIHEGTLIKSFVDKYIGDVDDTSETVILRLYDDWLNSAATISTQVLDLWSSRNYDSSINLERDELTLINNKKASDVQMLMHSKVVLINKQIEQAANQLQKNFVDYADVFYSKYYGPALDYRLQVNRYQMPYNSGILGREAWVTAGNLDAHLSALMADQMRRHQSFTGEVQGMLAGMTMREQYKDYINKLSDRGDAYAVGSPGTMLRSKLPVDAQEKLTKIVEQNKNVPAADTIRLPVEPAFTAHHDELDGRENPNAHPQYVTKDEFESTTGIRLQGLDRARQVAAENGANPRGLDVATVATSGAGPNVIQQVAQNGLLSATSKSRPVNVPAGQVIYEVDTKAVLYWDGKTWRYVTGGPPDYTSTFMVMGT